MDSGIRVILVRPRNPDNIGAAARAMANFGLADLALAGAFGNDWAEAAKGWKAEASVAAIGAMDVVESARLCATIPEAAEGCDLLLGTSSLHFLTPDRDVVLLKDAAAFARRRGARRVGVLFGAEKTGLTREDLSYCAAIVNIPTLPKQPSMNLGQAVAVACYELAGRGAESPRAGRAKGRPLPPAELDRLVSAVSAKLTREAGPHWAGKAQIRAIRRSLTDARLTKDAVNALRLLVGDLEGGTH